MPKALVLEYAPYVDLPNNKQFPFKAFCSFSPEGLATFKWVTVEGILYLHSKQFYVHRALPADQVNLGYYWVLSCPITGALIYGEPTGSRDACASGGSARLQKRWYQYAEAVDRHMRVRSFVRRTTISPAILMLLL